MDHRLVFMGSPDYAVPILKLLTQRFSVVGIVTQPDRPAGRGRILTSPPVKILALELGIPFIQPENLNKDKAAITTITSWRPDVIIVAAFGQILDEKILDLAPWGCVNVHASLLPRWRGASPIQAAILNGDKFTGVTIMKMDRGVDTGDIISQKSIQIEPDDTGGTLYKKLSVLGGELLTEALPGYLCGDIQPDKQGESPTPYASILKKSDGKLNFDRSASYLERKVRAYNPWPGTYTYWKGKTLKIISAHAVDTQSPGIGILIIFNGLPSIGTKNGLLVIDILQPSGKIPMSGDVFLRGARDWESS
jgi:methionyl-tRNA formyltransferase